MNPNQKIILNTGNRRIRVALSLSIAILMIFGLRLFQLQALDAPQLAATAAENRTRTLILPAQRGEITDRNGAPLAITVDARNITVDQTMVIDPVGTAQSIASITGVEKEILIPVCPEQLGGLPTPRSPYEIKNGRLISRSGQDSR